MRTYKDITDESKPEKTKAENSSLLVATGQTTPVCNIYDMGGNVFEWTTESFSARAVLTLFVEAVTATVSRIFQPVFAMTFLTLPTLAVVSGSLYLCRPEPWML